MVVVGWFGVFAFAWRDCCGLRDFLDTSALGYGMIQILVRSVTLVGFGCFGLFWWGGFGDLLLCFGFGVAELVGWVWL